MNTSLPRLQLPLRLPLLPIRFKLAKTNAVNVTSLTTTTNMTQVQNAEDQQEQEKEKEKNLNKDKEEALFLEHLKSVIELAKNKNEVQTGLSVPNGIIDEQWLYLKDFLAFSSKIQTQADKKLQISFQSLDDELKPLLTIGTIKVYNCIHQERRQTAYFSLDNAIMRYSGRVLQPNAVIDGTIINRIFNLVNSDGFQHLMLSEYNLQMPRFNAVFINKYRSAKELKDASIDRVDMLGWHADDEREHTSDTILSFTVCEIGGERVFELRPKKATSGVSRQVQLESLSCFIMLPGCQSRWKHRISDRVTQLNHNYITGARYNLTFRSLTT